MRFDHLIIKQVHIPNYQGPRCEIIGAFLGDSSFRRWSIIAFASHFHGEKWGTLEEFHSRPFTSIESCIRTERFAIWQIDSKGRIVIDSVARLRSARVFAKTDK